MIVVLTCLDCPDPVRVGKGLVADQELLVFLGEDIVRNNSCDHKQLDQLLFHRRTDERMPTDVVCVAEVPAQGEGESSLARADWPAEITTHQEINSTRTSQTNLRSTYPPIPIVNPRSFQSLLL